MEILGTAQHAAFRAGEVPAPEEFSEGMWAVPMELPGEFPRGFQSYSFAYVLDDFSGGLHVIDPGWDLPKNLRRWEEFFATLGRSFVDVASLTATHLHHDHLGLAKEFADRSGAPLIMHKREVDVLVDIAAAFELGDTAEANRASRVYAEMTKERLEEFRVPRERWTELLEMPPAPEFLMPQKRVEDGQALPIISRQLEVIWTPGHTGGQICLAEKATKVIFTADHVLPGINSGLGLGGPSPTNPIADYLGSLERIEGYDDYVVAPGHEYRFHGLAERAHALRKHHLRRSQEVEAAMESSSSIWEIASRVTWSDGFENLRSHRLSSALSQVAMHREYVLSNEW